MKQRIVASAKQLQVNKRRQWNSGLWAGVVWVGLDEPQAERRGPLKIILRTEILKLTYLLSIYL